MNFIFSFLATITNLDPKKSKEIEKSGNKYMIEAAARHLGWKKIQISTHTQILEKNQI